jgi:plastocyanin
VRRVALAGLVLVAAAVPAAARAQHPTAHGAPSTPAAGAEAPPLGTAPPVGMANKLFNPATISALVGEPVTWVNDDTIAHDVAISDGSFDSGRMEPSARVQHAFSAQGTFVYRCTLHAFMYGTLRVHGLALAATGPAAAPGARMTLSGRAPVAAAAAEVAIEQRAPDGGFVPVGSARPGADGAFSAQVAPAVPATFRARAGELVSQEVRVAVRPRIVLRARRSGRRIAVTVATTPAQPGAPVVLQRYRRERFDFRTVARRSLDRTTSTAGFSLRSRHWERVRVKLLRGVGGFGSATSRPVTVLVHPPKARRPAQRHRPQAHH